MSTITRVFVLLVSSMISWSSYANDIPFAADALRHLSQESQYIVKAGEPVRLSSEAVSLDDPTRVPYALYYVRVQEVLKGDMAVESKIRVALPESLNVRRVNELEDTILFVRQFSADDLEQTNIPVGDPAYFVVGGRYGVVDARPDNRIEAITEYIGSTRSEAVRGETVLTWTEKYLNSPDPFLQHSAVIDLFYERSRPRALEQLGAALRSNVVLPNVKQTAIQALGASGAAAAAQLLREIAEDEKVQRRLREAAVKAFQNVPGGSDQLLRWSEMGHTVLSPAAQSTIRALQERIR